MVPKFSPQQNKSNGPVIEKITFNPDEVQSPTITLKRERRVSKKITLKNPQKNLPTN
jgi:hypothetical protein